MSDVPVVAINLITLRDGVPIEEFATFSAEVDQPICTAQDVVQGFDAFAVTRRDPQAPLVDVVEVMHVRSWEEWVRVRDGSAALRPVVEGFDRLVEATAVTTLFGASIRPQSR